MRGDYKFIPFGTALCALLSTTAISSALAQQPAQAGAGTQVDEVVITARQFSETLQTAPIAVTVLTSQDIAKRGVESVGDIANLAPNVDFNQSLSLGSSQLTIRGQTQENFAPPPAAIVVDGVLQISPAQFNVDEFDLEQVEVLKGPQGALYGKNAIAGALNITTVKPNDEFRARALAGYARGEEYKAKVSISGPVIPGRLYVLGGLSFEDRRGQIQNITNGHYADKNEDFTQRLRVVATPSDDLELDVKYTHSKAWGPDTQGVPSATGDPRFSNDPFVANVVATNPRNLHDLSGKLTWDADFATVTGTLAYVNVKEDINQELDYTPLDITRARQFQRDDGFSQELRVASTTESKLRWMFGGYHVRYDSEVDVAIFADPFYFGLAPAPSAPTFPLGGSVDTTRHEDWAGFAHAGYALTSELSLELDLRYDRERVRLVTQGSPVVQRATFAKWQPKGTLTYTPSEDLTYYGSVGRGFRVGDFNASNRSFGEAVVKAEVATTYELGAKTRLLDRRLILNAAVYYTDLKNGQFALFDAASSSDARINIDKIRIQGFELESALRVSDDLSLSGSVGYTDAKIKAFTVPAGFSGMSSDFIGNRPLRVPKFTANFGVDFSTPVSEHMDFFFRPQYRYTGTFYWDPLNDYKRPSKHNLNVRTGVSDADDRWTLTGYVENFFNDKVTASYNPVTTTGSPFGADIYYPPLGRVYGVELAYRF